MAKYRRDRINEEIQKEMTSILRKVKDPRVSDAFISVTAADCTADLKYIAVCFHLFLQHSISLTQKSSSTVKSDTDCCCL